MTQPWHLGPVPPTSDEALRGAFQAALDGQNGNVGIWLDSYKVKKSSEAVDPHCILQHKVLLGSMLAAQPSARFKSVHLRTCLLEVKMMNPKKVVNPTKLPDVQWARLLASQVLTLLYHVRRTMTSKKTMDQALKHLAPSEVTQFKELFEKLHAPDQKKHPTSTKKDQQAKARQKSPSPSLDSDGIPKGLDDLLDSPDPEAGGSAGCGIDAIVLQAHEASEQALPPGRGALKKMILKKPSGHGAAPTCVTPSFGLCKLVLATQQSYILAHHAGDNKWGLLVACAWSNHKDVMQKLWSEVCKKKNLTKGGVVAMKFAMKTFKKPAAMTSSSSSASSMLAWMDQEFSLQASTVDQEDLGKDDPSQQTEEEDSFPAPPWWEELAS